MQTGMCVARVPISVLVSASAFVLAYATSADKSAIERKKERPRGIERECKEERERK